MCDSSNAKPFSFCFGSGRENGFNFCAAAMGYGGGRMAGYKKTTSPAPPSTTSPNHQQSAAPSSQWRFSYPSDTLDDEETEERNSNCKPQENECLEKAKPTSSPLSAITGVIPCHFEGFTYSSQPPTPPISTSAEVEEVIKTEKHEVIETEQSSSQIILVSRILKGIPQSPHFQPLKGYSEVAKHSLMNAWDHIFEEVVDQIQSMQVNTFWVEARRLWETMEELQKMGYNVIALRRRLVELTDVILTLRRHRSEIRELKSKAEEQRTEKSRLEFEIAKLRAKAEALKAGYAVVMVNVENMEKQLPRFDDVFSKIATKNLEIT